MAGLVELAKKFDVNAEFTYPKSSQVGPPSSVEEEKSKKPFVETENCV